MARKSGQIGSKSHRDEKIVAQSSSKHTFSTKFSDQSDYVKLYSYEQVRSDLKFHRAYIFQPNSFKNRVGLGQFCHLFSSNHAPAISNLAALKHYRHKHGISHILNSIYLLRSCLKIIIQYQLSNGDVKFGNTYSAISK